MNNILCFYFVAYYFALNIVALSETMRNGSISFGLLNDLGDLEYSTLYE
jgi:phosphatidic acid-selective phospholipase A1